jgi:hypothetical protein
VQPQGAKLRLLAATGAVAATLAAGCGGGGNSTVTPTTSSSEAAKEHPQLRPEVEAAKQRLEEHGTANPKAAVRDARSEAARRIDQAEREAKRKLRSVERQAGGLRAP